MKNKERTKKFIQVILTTLFVIFVVVYTLLSSLSDHLIVRHHENMMLTIESQLTETELKEVIVDSKRLTNMHPSNLHKDGNIIVDTIVSLVLKPYDAVLFIKGYYDFSDKWPVLPEK